MENISGKESEEAREEEEEESGDFFGEPIYTYTSKQAVDDGILFDITKLNARFEKGLFNCVTANLLSDGYFGAGEQINLSNLMDLLNQAHNIVKTKTNNFKNFDTFFSGTIELPSGEKQKIFIQQNETGKFTIMLPQDY